MVLELVVVVLRLVVTVVVVVLLVVSVRKASSGPFISEGDLRSSGRVELDED